MFDLTNFTLRDMTVCGAALRRLGGPGQSLEQVAQATTRYLFDHFVDRRTGARSCALVRFFKTHPFRQLDPDLQAFAARLLDGPSPPGMKCLTLLASTGTAPAWNARRTSVGHQAIPLPSAELSVRLPMIARLLQQFGLEVEALLQPDPQLLMDLEQRSYNVFHVPEARDSPYVPAQKEFVQPYGIRSVLGFGGVLPAGELFAIILFTRVLIPRATAELFKPLALCTKLAILPFVEGPGLTESGEAETAGETLP